jgi:hypothetical protein
VGGSRTSSPKPPGSPAVKGSHLSPRRGPQSRGAACAIAQWQIVVIGVALVLVILAFGGPFERAETNRRSSKRRPAQFGAVFGSHSRERRELTQSTGTESCTAANRPTLDRRPRLLSPSATEKTAGIAKQICPDTWIGISAHNDSAGLTAGGPTDNIRFRRIARHGRYARRRVRVSLVDIRTLPVRLPSIGR